MMNWIIKATLSDDDDEKFEEYMSEEFEFEFPNIIIVCDRYILLCALLSATFILGSFLFAALVLF